MTDSRSKLAIAIFEASSKEGGFVEWPAGQPLQYNGSGEPCDMWIGPCICGATHIKEQRQRCKDKSP